MEIINTKYQGLIVEPELSNTKKPAWDPKGKHNHWVMRMSRYVFEGRGKWAHAAADFFQCQFGTEEGLPISIDEFLDCWTSDAMNGRDYPDLDSFMAELGYLDEQRQEARRALTLCKQYYRAAMRMGLDLDKLAAEVRTYTGG